MRDALDNVVYTFNIYNSAVTAHIGPKQYISIEADNTSIWLMSRRRGNEIILILSSRMCSIGKWYDVNENIPNTSMDPTEENRTKKIPWRVKNIDGDGGFPNGQKKNTPLFSLPWWRWLMDWGHWQEKITSDIGIGCKPFVPFCMPFFLFRSSSYFLFYYSVILSSFCSHTLLYIPRLAVTGPSPFAFCMYDFRYFSHPS